MKTPMDLLLIVPARSGSVRLPNKNKRMFLGKPLYAWTLTFIEEIGLKSKTILSTDDQEIAREAIKMGFDVPWLRPAQLAKSATTSSTVVTHAIQASNLAFSNNSLVALLQVTTPFREKSTFERLLELASEPEEVGAVSVQEVSGGGYSLNSLERLVKGEGDVHGED